MKGTQASCPCGFIGPAKTIRSHRWKCHVYRKEIDRKRAKEQRERERNFVLTEI